MGTCNDQNLWYIALDPQRRGANHEQEEEHTQSENDEKYVDAVRILSKPVGVADLRRSCQRGANTARLGLGKHFGRAQLRLLRLTVARLDHEDARVDEDECQIDQKHHGAIHGSVYAGCGRATVGVQTHTSALAPSWM
eukprot:7330004-Prymnesium_polylepis.1